MLSPSIKYFPSEKEFSNYKVNDLGVHYTPEKTVFKLWSPLASKVMLTLYEDGYKSTPSEQHFLTKNTNGIWELAIHADIKNQYYTYNVNYQDQFLGETPGIYAKAVGVNGKRGMVIDMQETNPPTWEKDDFIPTKGPTNMVLYELHVRDFSIHESAQSDYPGKFLGLGQTGKTLPNGTKTGIDHLTELGITHVHLLPVFDFMSLDEAKLKQRKYNWGYDPDNYNVPEGTYATDPFNAAVRIREFKTAIKQFHDQGIGVVMDVVFNHTGPVNDSNFNKEFPNYYYRFTPNQKYSDGTGCRSETASEKAMMRKYIIDSCSFWATEYHIDGFRFDLMGVHDIETMNAVSEQLHKINPHTIVYGEGWAAGGCALDEQLRAVKHQTMQLKKVAAFSDDIRDALKGSVFNLHDNGFIGGEANNAEQLKPSIAASVQHHQLNGFAWAPSPAQCINYVSCHDNFTLFDKLKHSSPNASEDEIRYMQKLALAIILTSQGIPFLHAGSEFMRSKNGHHDSYNKPDSINQINWYLKTQNQQIVDYTKDLIQLRKNHPAFCMSTQEAVNKHLLFWDTYNENVVAYQLLKHANNDSWKNIVVILNGQKAPFTAFLPKGDWYLAVDRDKVYPQGIKSIQGGEFHVDPISCTVFFEA